MIRIGPASGLENFFALGCDTHNIPAWMTEMGLGAIEFSFGNGVKIRDETADYIKNMFENYDIVFSVHAPYYVNFANDSPTRKEHSFAHLLDSVKICDRLGGSRVVFHPGAAKNLLKSEAFDISLQNLIEARKRLCDMSYGHIHLCPEVIGSINQVGNLDEILRLCEADDSFIPTIDFGHIHALEQGSLNTPEDFDDILRRGIDALGKDRFRQFHVHFSRVAYGASGERTHMSFCDTGFGPEYSHLIPLLVERSMTPTIICESRRTQIEDAVEMVCFLNRIIGKSELSRPVQLIGEPAGQ